MTEITRREAMALISGALAGAGLGGRAHAQGTPKRGGTLRISAPANPSSLDPATGGAGSDHAFLFTMYDTLTEWDFETLKPKPGLAESWKLYRPDHARAQHPRRRHLSRRHAARCRSGQVQPRAQQERPEIQHQGRSRLDGVSRGHRSDAGHAETEYARCRAARHPLRPRRHDGLADSAEGGEAGNVARKPVGAGAYAFVSWADGEKIVVKRNEKYWKANRPYPDGIEFSIIPELTTGARSVTAGQNDLIYQLPPRQKAIMERASNIKVFNGPTLYVFQIFLNWAKPPFDNVKVRQAFNFAIDREAFVKAALAGLAEPAYMNLPKSHWAYDKSVAELYPHDPDKARKLLAEAGFKEGTAIDLVGYSDQDSVQREEILIEQFRKAGMNVKFSNAPIAEAAAAFFGAEKRGSGLLAAWTGRPDPSLTYSLMFTKDAYYNGGRAPVPPELEAAIKESRASEDIEVRRKAFATVQRLVMENALVAPLAFQFELVAMNKKVQGYRPNLLGKPKYDDVWLES